MDTIVIGGGQAGLTATRALLDAGLTPVLLEATDQTTGSWGRYYDSLTLFSPARYSSLPGFPFGGDPDRYPRRDEVVDYLARYARDLGRGGAEIRTGARVTAVEADTHRGARGGGFAVHLADGSTLNAPTVIAASGSFDRPHLPVLPGRDGFTGQILHAAAYTGPLPYAGRRVVVVGAGNSAVQIAYELAETTTVTLATRTPIRFVDQRPLGKDLHFWFTLTGFDRLPARLVTTPPTVPVLDEGAYRQALRDGRLDRRPIFTRLDEGDVVWADGSREPVDVVLLATGYRPNLDYLNGLGALDERGHPRHDRGLSTTHPGLGFLGLEWQRTPASNTLRGVGRDARHLTGKLTTHLNTRRFRAGV
ncbi:NAD(P)/FAD-dependent oxidoreductase [Streptosporangium sp. NBC_01755]|uniref:flavin-containing monooxygenase n=1 Tax=unclassified Streptosporangium TaxID=2632669 RepID=UPI002DDBA994|nr:MULTISPECIES: NAD(P)/FAD-dependent oxidoreductase [unclassified Streptosporangium]WSA28421.1 NAD(P)/FAD-dependent oxidoreductase [Streptosporangium sp. NBC_01810]WSD00089.1 NAD(P)/FAD-dependent oxidoreductase [Streptosporangium sp. NBC_01755]